MIVKNKFGEELNILHFCGGSKDAFPKTLANIYYNCKLNPIESNLTLLSCWTDYSKCILNNQLTKNGIFELKNVIPEKYDYSKKWYMPFKISYILQYLINHVNTEYTLILDGYDTLFVSTDNIIEKFVSQEYKILFNATCNNYPNIEIDVIPNRESLGMHKYFNAGCCIGYTKDLIKFYSKALKYINYTNELNSEQFLLRHAFSEYSNIKNQTFVGIDYNSLIFRTMGKTKVEYNQESKILQLTDFEGDD